MSKENTIRLAQEAGLTDEVLVPWAFEIDRFAELIRKDYSFTHAQLWLKRFDDAIKAEREAVLDLVDDYAKGNTDLRDAIRARNNT